MHNSVRSSINAQQIQAIDLTVSNLDRAVSFYTQALCFEIVSDITVIKKSFNPTSANSQCKIRITTLKLGDEQIRLMQYLDRQGEPIPTDSKSNDLWFQHLAIVVSDMDRAYAHLQNFPFEAISTSPQTIPPGNKEAAYIQAFKFRDPDRHPLELIWFPPDKGQLKWQQKEGLFLGIDHTAIAIANTEPSLQFYRDYLGMQIDGGSFNWRETQARMDGLPDAKVRITALRPAQGGLGVELLDYIEPANGRPMLSELQSFDIAYVQVELIVDQLANQLHHNEVIYTPECSNQAQNSLSAEYGGYQIKDPTGHSLLLIPRKT